LLGTPSLTDFRIAMPNLQKVCEDSGAVFAVFWELKDGLLQATEHYNPLERIEKIRKDTMKDDLYSTEAYKFQIAPGDGIVGKVYASSEQAFYQDVSQLSSDAYIRSEIAEKYGMKSVAVMPYEGGVLEVGTDLEEDWGRSWSERFLSRLSEEQLRMPAVETGFETSPTPIMCS